MYRSARSFFLYCSHPSSSIENVRILSFGFQYTVYHLENAEMTTELRDDLINFSFDNLHNVFKNYHTQYPDENYNIFSFFPRFLECVKKLVCHHVHSCIHCILIFTHFSMQPLALSEPNIIGQTLQIHFDRMLCDVLEKYNSFPGLTLLLGSIFQYVSLKQPFGLFPGIVALSYFIWKQGDGPTLDDTGSFGANRIFHHISGIYSLPGTPEFFSYLMELLESPERSGTHIFDQQRYVVSMGVGPPSIPPGEISSFFGIG
jgi:hypothetical protein